MTDPRHPTPHHPTKEVRDGRHRLDTPIVPTPDRAGAWRWTTAAIATATVLLASLDAPAIADWFDERPPSRLTEPLRAPIAGWTALTEPLDAPRAWLRARWQAARAARFGHEEPGAHGEAAGDG